MIKRYLDETGLADVAGHVNTRLKTVTTMPTTADEGATRLFCGESTANFKKGHIYQMTATEQNFLMFSADTSTYFMSEDGTITDVAPASYSPQIENVPFTDSETGATLVYMAGNNALVQKLGNDVNVITVNFNKIKTSVMPWWTAGAATGSYNPFTIRNVALVAVTAWVDITPSGSIVSVASKSALTSEWQGMTDDSTAIVNVTASFALNDTYNIPTGRHLLLKGGESDKSTLWTNDGKKFNAQYITNDLVFTELNDEQTLKYDTLPDAQNMGEGKIALYNGPTTQDLIHGHFYETKGESGTIYVPTTDTEPQVSEYGFYDGSEHWVTFASATPAIGDTVLSSDDSTLIGLEITAVEDNTVTVNDVVFTKNPDYDKFIQYYADANGTPYTEPLTHSSNPQELGLYLPSSGTIYHWEECNYGARDASALNYDNTESGLAATNVQDAIDEVADKGIIQLSTLPTPSADNLGKIIQYVGADTLELKNGMFYQVQIIEGSDPAEYYWNSIKVSNCSEKQDKVLETPITVQGVEKTTVEGALGAINDAVESLPSIMTPKGSVAFANLPAIADRYVEVTPAGTENPSEEGWYEKVDDNYVLSEDTEVDSEKTYYEKVSPTVDVQLGWMYNITDAFVTTDEFMEGAGKSYGAGQNVVAVEYTEGVKKWDVLSGELNLSDYKTIWNGTREAWNNLPLAEKQRYDLANLTDDLAGGELIVSDTVTKGDLNPVTSNAVAERTTLKSISITAVSGAVATVTTSETSFAEGQFVRVNVASGVTMSGFWGTASALSDLGVDNIQVAGSVGNSSRIVIALGVIQKSGSTLYLDIFG